MARDDGGASDALAVMGAVAMGAVIGAAAALLLAPKAGEELRSDLGEAAAKARERAGQLRGQMAEKYEELRARLERIEEDVVGAGEELAEDVGKQVQVEDA